MFCVCVFLAIINGVPHYMGMLLLDMCQGVMKEFPVFLKDAVCHSATKMKVKENVYCMKNYVLNVLLSQESALSGKGFPSMSVKST